jgi:hypothetical protein
MDSASNHPPLLYHQNLQGCPRDCPGKRLPQALVIQQGNATLTLPRRIDVNKQTYFYTVMVEDPGAWDKYTRLRLEIRTTEYGNPVVALVWQANRIEEGQEQKAGTWDKHWSEWYAADLEVSARDLETLEVATKAAHAALDSKEPWKRPEVADVLLRLAKKKARFTETVWDARLSQHVPLAQVKPHEYSAYTADHIRMGTSNPTLSVMARNDGEAQRLLVVELAQQGYDSVLDAFVTLGKPVHRIDREGPGDCRPAIERLHIEAPRELDMDEALAVLKSFEE